MQYRGQGASPRNEAPQAVRTGFAGSADTVSLPHYTMETPPGIPLHLCPRCASPGPHRSGPGAGPHYARLLCGACGRWLRWLPRPRPVAQEGRS